MGRARPWRPSSAYVTGPGRRPSLVSYIKAICFLISALLRGSDARRNRMLDRGSPCPEPVRMVMTIPCLPLTSTLAKPTRVYCLRACTTISGMPNALRACTMTLCPTLSNAFSISKETSWSGLLCLLASSIKWVASNEGSWIPFWGIKPCWCGPTSLGRILVSLLARILEGIL